MPQINANKLVCPLFMKHGNVSFTQIKLIVRAGLLSRELANTKAHICPGCAYEKALCKPWRYNGIQNFRPIKTVTALGDIVSMDQLIIPILDFVPTHRGLPTLQCCVGVIIFVDHYSYLTYAHLMTEIDDVSTGEAKLVFECITQSHSMTIKYYHCDNDIFNTKVFKVSIIKASQTISFC